jgi:cell division protein FtsL
MSPPPAAAAAPAVAPRRPARGVRPSRSTRPARGTSPPRRVSGPARRAPRGGAAAPAATGGLLEALAGRSRLDLLEGRLTDLRSIGSRAWIALVTFALIGIVAMQLWMVKLNVGIGRALEHEASLQRENSTLSIDDSMQSSGERIEQLAAARGMVIAPPGALHFEQARGALDVRLAAAALARPLQQTQTLAASPVASGSTGAPTGSETSSGEAAAEQAPAAGTVPAASG